MHQRPMRHLLTSLALFATFAAAGQVDGVQLPYNPDVEPDGFIGINDVLAILPLYGQEYSSEELLVSADSSHTLLHVGDMNFYQCSGACASLMGSWRLPSIEDFGRYEELVSECPDVGCFSTRWINLPEYNHIGNSAAVLYQAWVPNIETRDIHYSQVECWCATQERPKVEYLVLDPMESIYNDSAVEFEPWLNEKAQEGWRLMPTPAGYAEPGTWVVLWRWAE